jgi:hypothetical protein
MCGHKVAHLPNFISHSDIQAVPLNRLSKLAHDPVYHSVVEHLRGVAHESRRSFLCPDHDRLVGRMRTRCRSQVLTRGTATAVHNNYYLGRQLLLGGGCS